MNPTSSRSHSKPHFFPLYKVLHGTFSKHTEIPREKAKIQKKIVNQKGFFHKTPSSEFYLIGTSSGLNPFSLTLLIACLMTCDRFDGGERSKSKLGNSFLRYQASTFLFSFLLLLLLFNLFFLLCLCYNLFVYSRFMFSCIF